MMRSKGSLIGLAQHGGLAADAEAACRLGGRRGRPCQIAEPERRQLLLDAAESVFLELGYSAASMDDIARRAGMSKKTLYRLFETKESLFAAVIAARRASLNVTIEPGECADAPAAGEALRRYLGVMARFVLAPRQAALYRLVIAESQRAPELAHSFHREGPSKCRALLSDWLALQHARGSLHVADPQSAAGMLFSMVISDLQMCVLIGERGAPDEALIDRGVNRAVELFLEGAAPRDKKIAGQERG
jgi:AcrR family transcriptional regulator